MTLIEQFSSLRRSLEERVIGQPLLVERLLIGLLADGHLLIEGPPGVAKTRAVRELAGMIAADFHRIQFTPDLLPADLTGGEMYRPQDGSFHFEPGPIFHSLLLADEINRAPAKVQSALLEAMGERQVTIGQRSYPLSPLFMVMATQNPIEHEGTYPLPEAQLDRFLLHVRVGYPTPESERAILELARREAREGPRSGNTGAALLSPENVLAARMAVLDLHVAPSVADYMLRLITATRRPETIAPELADALEFGASPRGTMAIERTSRARAWLAGRNFVTPEDVQSVLPDALRHRLWLRHEALADGLTADRIIETLLERVDVP